MSKPEYKQNSKFNLTIAPLKKSPKGNLTWVINPEIFDALSKVEVGGMFIVKYIDESKRKSENSPHAYLEYVEKSQVESFRSAPKRIVESDDVI